MRAELGIRIDSQRKQLKATAEVTSNIGRFTFEKLPGRRSSVSRTPVPTMYRWYSRANWQHATKRKGLECRGDRLPGRAQNLKNHTYRSFSQLGRLGLLETVVCN